jgi:hypothetical protein
MMSLASVAKAETIVTTEVTRCLRLLEGYERNADRGRQSRYHKTTLATVRGPPE